MLTPRLKMIVSGIKKCVCVADIGTDHAYIPIHLVKTGIAQTALACDVREGPCAIAFENIKKYKLSDKIEVRMSDGLNALVPNECDCIVIAGMGGLLIQKILSDNMQIAKSANQLILQPMTDHELLRKFLADNGFCIYDEDLSAEGKRIYSLFCVREGEMSFENEIDYHINPILKNHPLYAKLVRQKKAEWEKIVSGCMRAKNTEEVQTAKYEALLNSLSLLDV